jgi:hypothetical protein
LGCWTRRQASISRKIFAIDELSKGQTEELVPAGEIFDVAIALAPIDADLKLIAGEEVQELRENGSAWVHLLPPEQAAKRRMMPKDKQKTEIEKTHRDPLVSSNQAVRPNCSDFLGTALIQDQRAYLKIGA